jgi:uncharacterized damage-inducible protein DinB
VLAEIDRLVRHQTWADRAVLAVLRENAAEPALPQVLRVFGHLLGAQELWLQRIEGTELPPVVWPERSLSQCAGALDALEERWGRTLAALREDDLGRLVPYVNSKGQPFTSSVGDILLHVVMHSSYHRGQIALLLRSAGVEPPYTDLIHAIRLGSLS